MSDMITLAQGFQYSVNIGYDLNSNEKLQNFIPTKSSLQLLEDILASTNENSINRARVLIGAYGKGKSHIVLTILSILMKKDLSLFTNLMPVVEKNPALQHAVRNYYDSKNKINQRKQHEYDAGVFACTSKGTCRQRFVGYYAGI